MKHKNIILVWEHSFRRFFSSMNIATWQIHITKGKSLKLQQSQVLILSSSNIEVLAQNMPSRIQIKLLQKFLGSLPFQLHVFLYYTPENSHVP